tara:strand:+ start:667 stop:846 length:180 start_codon:yes stop_codon:yes gene_type:complete
MCFGAVVLRRFVSLVGLRPGGINQTPLAVAARHRGLLCVYRQRGFFQNKLDILSDMVIY